MKYLVFLGTVRDSTPPKPARLGERVAKACVNYLEQSFDNAEVELIDPLDYPFEDVFKPHFSYHEKDVPEQLDALAKKIEAADAYVMVSPEYNHSMSPALANLLNHFGASLYSYKPSAIVTYSAGQWGGVRAAVNMRTFLSELGCLPVSAMIHVPKAQTVFEENGKFTQEVEDTERWIQYFGRTLNQLCWWAEAAQKQREALNPHKLVSDFKSDPSQRNAPDSDRK
ncbi:NAD(P)H-dependent oxidoreductase [Idiomarina loihiensis]|jgi:NAD(P)H-dependent FMN reductase|uniref:Predicted flavoprotein n=1 Tax=Idiomarina loihiensis (strain ATCC BAA-735 / DSM 15497 / L2-TR) TaxID=283942 RepID=Q5QVD3_IDILO|nr:NAD(P)H-dependent oxidoreductase [Idiomarina loihiensis]PHQ90493.1 MAG: NADPH-dependent oxidoreductase [Idiomarina sp.]AAV82960.1 Predicted flavoprotein [Idiomarina loihiensis L2TR]AGM37005.1 flavoprotein [Idiomarina loihiensis GSL 199]MRJ44896.1 NADPH-dependent oxidoreductase [Idiomarina loihiensis]UTW33150.1 NAD(P)H-dependent oxidoreductase [Idiomarina loihiensis]